MKLKDYLAIVTILLMLITTVLGMLLGSFAIYFNRKMYKEIESVYESEK